MQHTFLIYGAYGYTGELIARLAVQQEHRPILAGRNEAKLARLANDLQLPHEAVDLKNRPALDALLRKVKLVLHCAGPFSQTARPMVEACLRNHVHYLDITGEIDVFEWIATRDDEAKRAGIVLLPGSGFDVVPSDCLAAHLKRLLPDARWLEMAFEGGQQVSRGTALTMVEGIAKGGMIRKLGKIKPVPAAFLTRKVRFNDDQERLVASIPWGDVSTAYYSTGIPNITVYMATTSAMLMGMKLTRYLGWLLKVKWIQNLLKKQVRKNVTGPDIHHRSTSRSRLWGEVRNPQGKIVTAYLETPEGYHLTAATALLSAQKILAGSVAPGFKTPSLAFGPDFILEIEGVTRIDE